VLEEVGGGGRRAATKFLRSQADAIVAGDFFAVDPLNRTQACVSAAAGPCPEGDGSSVMISMISGPRNAVVAAT